LDPRLINFTSPPSIKKKTIKKKKKHITKQKERKIRRAADPDGEIAMITPPETH